MAALDCFRRCCQTTTFVYVAESESRTVRNFLTDAILPEPHRFTVDEFLAAYDFRVQGDKTPKDWPKNRWEATCVIAKHACEKWIEIPSPPHKDKLGKDDKYLFQEGDIKIFDEDIESALIDIGFSIENHCVVGGVPKDLGMFLKSDWLEIFIYGLLEKHADVLEINDVRLGLEIQRNATSKMKNELDVAFMAGTLFSTVECKAGTKAEMDFLYKLAQISSLQGALHTQSFLVATSEAYFENNDIKPEIEERAGPYKIRLILKDEIAKLAENPENADSIKTIFSHKNRG